MAARFRGVRSAHYCFIIVCHINTPIQKMNIRYDFADIDSNDSADQSCHSVEHTYVSILYQIPNHKTLTYKVLHVLRCTQLYITNNGRC